MPNKLIIGRLYDLTESGGPNNTHFLKKKSSSNVCKCSALLEGREGVPHQWLLELPVPKHQSWA